MERGAVIGRDEELARLEDFVSSLGAGPAACVLSGEPGVGKTTLWQAGVATAVAHSARVLVARPAEAEAKLSFAAIGDLLDPALDEVLAELPGRQRRALEAALLLDEGEHPADPRTLAVAVLSGIRALARTTPLVLAIDDVQWLDAASEAVLRFVVRRLGDGRIGVLVSERVAAPGPTPLDLERALAAERLFVIVVGGLSVGALYRLLHERLDSALPRPVHLRVHEASAGNPFFALEIARELARHEVPLAPGDPLPLPGSLEDLLRVRLATLSEDALGTLLAAASVSEPTVAVVESATTGGARASLREARQAGVVEVDGDRIRFVHPLLASCVYQGADAETRRATHARLAEVVATLEERARHLALASEWPDGAVAAELDLAAEQAIRRGAPVVAARLLELAAEATPSTEPERLRRRLVDAAEQLRAGGQFAATRALLEPLLPELAQGPERARAQFILAWTAASWDDALALCRAALDEAEDDELRVRIHHWLGLVWLVHGDAPQAHGHARQAVEYAERTKNPASLCLAHGLHILASMAVSQPVPEDEVARARVYEDAAKEAPTFYTPSVAHAVLLSHQDRLDEARRTFEEGLQLVSERGDEEMVVVILFHLAELELRAGRWPIAAAHAALAYELVTSFDTPVRRGTYRYIQGTIAAHQGLAEEAREFLDEAAAVTEAYGDRFFAIETSSSLGFLELSLGELEAARDRLLPLPATLMEMGYREPALFQSLPTLVEALVGLGDADGAKRQAGLLEELAHAVAAPLALAQAARCRALVAAARGDLDEALAACEEANAHHERAPWPFEQGRTLLVHGTVLRRRGHRAEARGALGQALALFEQVGARLWTEKAESELARISGRRPGDGTLTASERELAALVARGLSNREAAAALYVTPKTVETKLSRIYAKLGIHSRTQLARWLAKEAEGGKPVGESRLPEPPAQL